MSFFRFIGMKLLTYIFLSLCSILFFLFKENVFGHHHYFGITFLFITGLIILCLIMKDLESWLGNKTSVRFASIFLNFLKGVTFLYFFLKLIDVH